MTRQNNTNILNLMRLSLIAIFVASCPFVWSPLANLSGLSLRLFDFAGFLLIFLSLSRKSWISGNLTVYLIFVVLVLSLLLSSLVNLSSIGHVISAVKILFFATVALISVETLERSSANSASKCFGLALLLVLMFLAINPIIFAALQNFFKTFPPTPRSIWTVWNAIFNTNVFIASNAVEVSGVAFRNSFAAGILASLVFTNIFIRRTTIRFFLNGVYLLLIVLAFSRSGWVALVFLFALLCFVNRKKGIGVIIISVVLISIVSVSPFVSELVLDRLNSDTGRSDHIIFALEIIDANTIWGAGDDVKYQGLNSEMNIHNVFLSYFAQYGILTFIISFLLSIIVFYFMINFIIGASQNSISSRKYIYLATAAFYIWLRPFVSASSDTFFSPGEWMLFACVVWGGKDFVISSSKPKKNIAYTYAIKPEEHA